MPVRKPISGTYFFRLYSANKSLFVFISLFFVLTVFANVIKLETTPFFIWNMYSTALKDSPVQIAEIRYNEGRLLSIPQTWREPGKIILTAPLYYYYMMTQMNQKDSFELYMKNNWLRRHPAWLPIVNKLYNADRNLAGFAPWYIERLEHWEKTPVNIVYVLKKDICFNTNGDLSEISCDTILIIKKSNGRKAESDH